MTWIIYEIVNKFTPSVVVVGRLDIVVDGAPGAVVVGKYSSWVVIGRLLVAEVVVVPNQ